MQCKHPGCKTIVSELVSKTVDQGIKIIDVVLNEMVKSKKEMKIGENNDRSSFTESREEYTIQ